MVVKVRTKSQITLPNRTVKNLGINEGDEYEIVERDDGSILLVPVVTYPKAYVTQLEQEVKETMSKVEKGEWPVFSSADEMLDHLKTDEL